MKTGNKLIDRVQNDLRTAITNIEAGKLHKAIDVIRTAISVVGAIPSNVSDDPWPFYEDPDKAQAAEEARIEARDRESGRVFRPH